MPELYTSKYYTINQLVDIFKAYCTDLNDPEELWIEGYDEFLFYRSDIEIRKTELTSKLKEIVKWGDQIIIKNAYNYLEIHEHGLGLLEDRYRESRYPLSHWWWYVDRIYHGTLEKPKL